MLDVSFNNFVAFGNRMSIDMRVTVSFTGRAGRLHHKVFSSVRENTGDTDGIALTFAEMSKETLALATEWMDANGLKDVASVLRDRMVVCNEINNSRRWDDHVLSFGYYVGFYYELNHEVLRQTETSDQSEGSFTGK